MKLKFETDYPSILAQLDAIDPIKYASTRNYVDGAITYLSPYIARGVISTKQVLAHVLAKGYKVSEIEKFVKELCWRDYFQRVAQVKDINLEIKQAQTSVLNHNIPLSVLNANTGIEGIDTAINQLYQTGYMHNHCRMYTAMLVCNVAKSHWLNPAQWLYYHLLDGDWASNACSWQWVAGANSSKKYVANQENINKYTHTNQTHTYLDVPYEVLETMPAPPELLTTEKFMAESALPPNSNLVVDHKLPTFIYNYYNLDPLWYKSLAGNRILLLEPNIFSQYPISKKCIDFMLALSANIPGMQVFVGAFNDLVTTYQLDTIYYKEHPFNQHYQGIEEPRDWIAEAVTGYYPSFFAYWKNVEKLLPN